MRELGGMGHDRGRRENKREFVRHLRYITRLELNSRMTLNHKPFWQAQLTLLVDPRVKL